MSRFSRPLAGSVALAMGFAAIPALTLAPARAQAPATPSAPPPAAAAAPADPVLARVDGQDIRMSDVMEAAQGLPAELRGMPPGQVMPLVLDHLIKQRAMVIQARKAKLDQQDDVKKAMQSAADRALQNAYVSREVTPQITDAAIRARYDRDIAGKSGVEEVHARHILVANEDVAKKIIADLKKGGDFAALAKQHSTDPGAQNGGDLGFFKKDDMVPEFANAAFALKPGEVSPTPVKTQFGYHVIKVEERRAAPPPSFEEAKDELRQRIIQDAVTKLSDTALAATKVERMNLDGSAPRATDGAQPPPAPTRR